MKTVGKSSGGKTGVLANFNDAAAAGDFYGIYIFI